MNRIVALAAVLAVTAGTSNAGAGGDSLLHEVLPKLALSSQRFEATLKRATFTVEGHVEAIGRDGKPTDRSEGAFRVHGDGKRHHFEVIRYTEDGEDKTEDAREKAAESSRKEPEEETHMPFLGSEQHKYVFHLREADKADPARVRIAFVPKHADKHLVVGSAWVDTRTGEVLTMGITPSENPLFVDYLRVTIEFGERMGEGPGVSRISFESSSGLLFFHRKFRGTARLFDYRVP